MTEPRQAEEPKKERRIEREIEVAAPIEEVWKALTDGKELARWYPLESRVTPGPKGKIFISWGPGCEGEAEIVAWQPGQKIAWKDPMALVEWTLERAAEKLSSGCCKVDSSAVPTGKRMVRFHQFRLELHAAQLAGCSRTPSGNPGKKWQQRLQEIFQN